MLNGNPAARLLDIFIAARNAPQKTSTHQVWIDLLGAENDVPLMYERLAKIMRLSEETYITMIELFPRQTRPTNVWKDALNSAFRSQNMLGTFDSFSTHLSDTAIDHLTAAADLLDTKNPTLLSAEDIANFIKKINELILEILEGPFEDKVNEYIVRSLRKIIIALESYRFSGSIPVTDSIEVMLGHSFFDSDYRGALNDTETGSKILNILGGIADAIAIVTPIAPLLLPVTVKSLLGFSG